MDGNDIDKRALEALYRAMRVDSEWSTLGTDHFSWWPKDFVQHVYVTTPVESAGHRVSRIIVKTPVASGVDESKRLYEVLNGQNFECVSLNALVVDSVCDTVNYAMAATVHEGVLPFAAAFLPVVAAMQATDAQSQAAALAEQRIGRFAVSAHPTSGPRNRADDTLHVVERLIVPLGERSSQWCGQEMLDMTAALKRTSLFAIGDDTGATAEFPFFQHTSLLRLNALSKHPLLGSGLGVTLQLPFNFTVQEMPPHVIAGYLNKMELSPDTISDFRGAWCVFPDGI